jgi:hypothetical protein
MCQKVRNKLEKFNPVSVFILQISSSSWYQLTFPGVRQALLSCPRQFAVGMLLSFVQFPSRRVRRAVSCDGVSAGLGAFPTAVASCNAMCATATSRSLSQGRMQPVSSSY